MTRCSTAGRCCRPCRIRATVGAVGNRLYTVSGDGQSAGSGIDHSAVAFNEILQVDLVLK